MLTRFLLCGLFTGVPLQAEKEITLLSAPNADAPVISKIKLSEKIISEALPALQNADTAWRQISLSTPFEAYVPVANLDRSITILAGTPAHALPTLSSPKITSVKKGDQYEVVRVEKAWACVRFSKEIKGYFLTSEGATQTTETSNASGRSEPAISPYIEESIVVSTSNTQAREPVPAIGPAKKARLLTGLLIREIVPEGPKYPIRLESPEGRFIAYVDLSGIFITDLSPYIGQKVYLRGEVHPLPKGSSQLVILVQNIQLAE